MSDSHSCSGNCSSCHEKHDDENCQMNAVLSKIKHKIIVMSGKGGVGKSTVSVNLASALALEGHRVGLLDIDVHGPSIPKMLGIENAKLMSDNERLLPIEIGNLKVMSAGLLFDEPDAAIIWRGPMKIGVIKQFLFDVAWDELDYLIIDAPPGTGDEVLSICQFIPDADGAVIVTTPQQVSAVDVARSIDFCRQIKLKVLGIIENMSGFACPDCGKITDIFSSGAGEALAQKYQLDFLGKIPIDPVICRGGDDGRPFIHHYKETVTSKVFADIVKSLIRG